MVTGLGVIASNGRGAENFFKNCMDGVSNVKKIPEKWRDYAQFTCDIWAPLDEINFTEYGISEIEQKQLEKTTLLSIACCFDSLKHAGLKITQADRKKNTYLIEGIDPLRGGVIFGTGIGGISSFAEAFSHQILNIQKTKLMEIAQSEENGRLKEICDKMVMPKRFNPFSVSMIMPNSSSANLGIKFGLNGLNTTVSQACASGTAAIGYAYEELTRGKLDFAITGGVEYLHDEYGGLYYSFDLLKTLCKPAEDILESNRPFDENRSGFLFSEGGCAVLVLEELEHAKKRNAKILAEIVSFSETNDAHNIMVMDDSGTNIERMIKTALENADMKAGEIDYINSHGTGTRLNDEIETAVIERIFGKKPVINSTKSLVGHTLGASGAIEALVTVMSMNNGMVHGCKNLRKPVRDLNFAFESREHRIKTALTHSFGFGGHNAGLIFSEFA